MGGGGVSTRVLPRGSVGPVCASLSSVASSYPPSFRRAPASTALFHHRGHARAHRNATSQRRRPRLRLRDPDPAPPLQPPPRRRLVPCPPRRRGCLRRRGRPASMPVLRGRPAPPPSYLRRRGRRVASARAQPRQLTARTPSTTPCLQVCVCMQTARRVLRRRLSAVVVRRCDAVCLRCAAHAARLAVAALVLLARVTTLPPSASLPVARCQRLITISTLHVVMSCGAVVSGMSDDIDFIATDLPEATRSMCSVLLLLRPCDGPVCRGRVRCARGCAMPDARRVPTFRVRVAVGCQVSVTVCPVWLLVCVMNGECPWTSAGGRTHSRFYIQHQRQRRSSDSAASS